MRYLALIAAAFFALFLYACGSSSSPTAVALDPLPSCPATVSTISPSLAILSPQNNGLFEGSFQVKINNFFYQPEQATDPRTEFANGKQTANAGHIHGWVFDAEGNQVRFYGAGGAEFADGIYVKTDELDPGEYRATFQLQHDDHTPAIPAKAPDFPGIASVSFTVGSL